MRDGDTLVDVARCAPETLRRLRRYRVAMVFQQFALLPTRTVGENVALGLELRGDPPDARARIVAEKLEMVGLGGWTHRPVGELSGGMDADILLMDEPFSALDAVIRRRLQDELRALHQRLGKTILFVTHDLAEAARLGDRIAVMHDGRIAQTGTLDQVLASPATDDVAQFLHEFHR